MKNTTRSPGGVFHGLQTHLLPPSREFKGERHVTHFPLMRTRDISP
ncbi:hypothetical protein [Pectobacterium brasiliense]